MQKIRHIAVEGNIGSGKTTASKALASFLGADLILESFEDNPFLEAFYKQQQVNPLRMEAHFLMERYFQLTEHFSTSSNISVSDYHFSKCLVFAKQNLEKQQNEVYESLWHILSRNTPSPDLVVYLDMATEQLIANINNRGREMETGLTVDYLEKISKNYREVLNKSDMMKSQLITVDGAELLGLSPRRIAKKLLGFLEEKGYDLVDN